ncbi:MAG: hypothetical protein GY711_05305 [bacterium]|nr:hypothetical protein [bacterium]
MSADEEPKSEELEVRPVEPDLSRPVPTEPVGFLDQFLVARLRSKKELEAVTIVLDNHLDRLRHQAESRSRESETYWNARSAETVAAMKTYAQAKLRLLENQRMASRWDAFQEAYELFDAKVREIEGGSLSDEVRETLIKKIRENLASTIERIEADTIAGQYDLKD